MDEKKQLDKQAREVRAAYFREWRKRNPDRVRAANKRYWEKRAARLAEERAKEVRSDGS